MRGDRIPGEAAGKRALPGRSEDPMAWYDEVVRTAGLADDAPAAGGLVVAPYAFRIWERIREAVDGMLRRTGHRNAAFPLLVPRSDLERESAAGDGTAARRAAFVTRAGDGELEEALAVRPPGAAAVWPVAGRWIGSPGDLPLLLNEWTRTVRWEDPGPPFLRSRESLRQTAHTAHASEEAAEAHARRMIGEYRDLLERRLALPVITGRTPPSRRARGAERSYRCEALVGGGRLLGVAGQHLLGRRLARAFDITYRTAEGDRAPVWNTSGGVSTRLIGALVLAHGDDRGLVLPPRVAPHQVVIVPAEGTEGRRALLLEVAGRIRRVLAREARVHVDDREDPGSEERAAAWELRGVPLRVEVDAEGVSRQRVRVVRRFGGSGPRTLKEAEALSTIPRMLDEMQRELTTGARDRREEATLRRPADREAWVERMDGVGGLVYAGWCGEEECRAEAEPETGRAVRLLADPEFQGEPGSAACLVCGREAETEALWARGV